MTYFQDWKLDLSSVTKLPHVLLLHLLWLRLLSSSTILGYTQPWGATLNHSQSGYIHNGIKRLDSFFNAFFWAFDKSEKVKTFTQSIKFNTRQNLSIFYTIFKPFFRKQWFSIFSFFTFKSFYTILVLTSACLSIGWNTREHSDLKFIRTGFVINRSSVARGAILQKYLYWITHWVSDGLPKLFLQCRQS